MITNFTFTYPYYTAPTDNIITNKHYKYYNKYYNMGISLMLLSTSVILYIYMKCMQNMMKGF